MNVEAVYDEVLMALGDTIDEDKSEDKAFLGTLRAASDSR